ncbi:MAG: 2-hydroxychromene-2-carboxylate isomerase [Polaromonas sp.]
MSAMAPSPPVLAGALKHISCYIDFISPYAYLAFELLPEALKGLSYSVGYQPVLFGAMLKHHGQLGPAEIAPKRDWTYRQVLWLAHSRGIALQMPASHPFNPLPLLRLALACSPLADAASPNRFVCETIFRHVWRGGAEAADPQRLAALVQQLAPPRDVQGEPVKAQLKVNTEAAIAAGVFGVPAFLVDDKLFWGLDSLPMLRGYLQGDAWFDGSDWQAGARVGAGIRRQ